MQLKIKTIIIILCVLIFAGIFPSSGLECFITADAEEDVKRDFIKWVDFKIPCEAMKKAIKLDVESQDKEVKLDWIELLAYLASKNGNNFKNYKDKQLDDLSKKLESGTTMEELTKDQKHYTYYHEAFSAVLSGFVGEYEIEVSDKNGESKHWEQKYGLKAFSPIAKTFPYNHSRDFGTGRSYGFSRTHLGNDLMGQVGTPIIAVESGIVEAMGWNQYGGWRIGIRSFDSKRYYYYAHLRKNFPYRKDLQEGSIVNAGDVIGYMGRTGYSRNENVNNINISHLHFGMQLIFDESQKECLSEIWIDVYEIVRLLDSNRSLTAKNPETKDYYRIYDIRDPVAQTTRIRHRIQNAVSSLFMIARLNMCLLWPENNTILNDISYSLFSTIVYYPTLHENSLYVLCVGYILQRIRA